MTAIQNSSAFVARMRREGSPLGGKDAGGDPGNVTPGLRCAPSGLKGHYALFTGRIATPSSLMRRFSRLAQAATTDSDGVGTPVI